MKKNKCHICNQFCSKSEKTLNLPNLKFISGTGKLMSVSKNTHFVKIVILLTQLIIGCGKKMLKKSFKL